MTKQVNLYRNSAEPVNNLHVQSAGFPTTRSTPFYLYPVLFTQSCPTLWVPWTVLPGSSVHGILQARILEWVAIPLSRRSSWLRDQTPRLLSASRFFTDWATREAYIIKYYLLKDLNLKTTWLLMLGIRFLCFHMEIPLS